MKITIPQYTTPLTKFIRTMEGKLVVVCGAVLAVTPIITNSFGMAVNNLKLGAGLSAITVTARSLLKAFASPSNPLPPIEDKSLEATVGELIPLATDEDMAQSTPEMATTAFGGAHIPAEQLTYAGAPSEGALQIGTK